METKITSRQLISLEDEKTVWRFLEATHPTYFKSDDVAKANDLAAILAGEHHESESATREYERLRDSIGTDVEDTIRQAAEAAYLALIVQLTAEAAKHAGLDNF